jgi:hypothetical protein
MRLGEVLGTRYAIAGDLQRGGDGCFVGGGGPGVRLLVVSKVMLRVSRSGRTTDEHGMLLHNWRTSVLEARCSASRIHQSDSHASVLLQSCATSKPSIYIL